MLVGLINNWKNKMMLFTRCPKPSRASSTPAVCTDYTGGSIKYLLLSTVIHSAAAQVQLQEPEPQRTH